MMRDVTVFGDRYAPVTSSIGFVRAPLDDVAETLQQWRAEIHGKATTSRLNGGLVENVERLEPLTGGVRPRELLIATREPDWTAVFDCGVQGGDQVTTVGVLARRMVVQGLVVVSIPDRRGSNGVPERCGARQFELFGPLENGFLNYVRTISVVRDGSRWRFDANGTIQDHEDVQAYSRRRIADRFTSEMLRDYASAVGVEPFADDFYSGPSVLVSNPAVVPPGGWSLTISEARRRFGIANV